MTSERLKRFLGIVLAMLIFLSQCLPVFASNNPQLLPEKQSPVIDLAKILTKSEQDKLETSLNTYQNETGWKIRVLTQFEKTPGLAVKDFWQLDETSLLLVADLRGGNILNFVVGDAYYALMPRLFWVELQTRYGNKYYVREKGESGSIIDAIDSVKTCLDKGGCNVVPGLTREQWVLTLITSIVGGLIAGFASSPRKENEIIAWKWLLLMSPLWIMICVFSITSVITRTNELLPLLRNIISFLACSVAGNLLAKVYTKKNDSEKSIE